MNQQNPLIERYITSFAAALQRHDLLEWKEIAGDVRSHISEALQYGKPLEDVLKALGPADALARAYAVELQMNPRSGASSVVGRFLAVFGILAASGLVTFIVLGVLGSIAVAFIGSGVAVVIIGAIEAMGVHLPHVQLAGMHPLAVAFGIGPVVILIGVLAAWALWLYMRALVNMLRKTLPRTLSPAPA
jgi:hypothetical protein